MEQVLRGVDGAAGQADAQGRRTWAVTATRPPLGPPAQLLALRAVLEQAETALLDAYAAASASMTDGSADDGARRAALSRLRALTWRIVQHVLPLPDQVPAALRAQPEHRACLAVRARLRRATQATFTSHTNWALDLAQDGARPLAPTP